jgi:hypothetical protein
MVNTFNINNIKTKSVFLFAFLFVTLSCRERENLSSGTESILVEKAFINKKVVNASQYIENIRYIPLESSSECYLPGKAKYIITDRYIITHKESTAFILFDKDNGDFIKKIENAGRGPEEYQMITDNGFYNPYNHSLYATKNLNRDILVYDLEGRFIETFRRPTYIEPSSHFPYLSCDIDSFLNDSIYVSGILNITGHVNKKLALCCRDSIIKIFPNFLKWGSEDPRENIENYMYSTSWRGSRIFFTYDGMLNFKEIFNDTLFFVTTESLLPRYVFDLGDKGVNYELQDKQLVSKAESFYMQYYMINNIFESNDFLFLSIEIQNINYLCVYDKKEKSLTVCDAIGTTTEEFDNGVIIPGSHPTGLKDDINGLLPFIPIQVTKENELVGVLEAGDIVEWENENPETLKALESELPWLKGINEYSNPVIVLGKLNN